MRLLGPTLSDALRLWDNVPLGEAIIFDVPERDGGTEGPPADDKRGSSCSSPTSSDFAFSSANRRWGWLSDVHNTVRDVLPE